MKAIKDMNMESLAAFLCTTLEKEGIETVLSGGCCVELYSKGRYTSDDIDLIDRYNGGHRKIKEIMQTIGFTEYKMKRYFVHKDTPLFIEFPRGPLGVGDAPIKEVASRKTGTGILKLLTPTDCIKDRLAAYYHWDDNQSLSQALWVAGENDFDMASVKKWSLNEGMEEKYNTFKNKLETLHIENRVCQDKKIPLCGIDEAGRGPLAGSLVIAGVVLTGQVDGLMDSKKLSEKKREALFPLVMSNSDFHIVSFSAEEVDRWGISECLKKGLEEIQKHLPHCHYLFDGNSTFGVENIETMVKADTKIAEVSAASILAKVTHDREIVKMAEVYPEYGFEKHKGYGTKAHIEALVKYGRCPIHRKTFNVKGLDR